MTSVGVYLGHVISFIKSQAHVAFSSQVYVLSAVVSCLNCNLVLVLLILELKKETRIVQNITIVSLQLERRGCTWMSDIVIITFLIRKEPELISTLQHRSFFKCKTQAYFPQRVDESYAMTDLDVAILNLALPRNVCHIPFFP